MDDGKGANQQNRAVSRPSPVTVMTGYFKVSDNCEQLAVINVIRSLDFVEYVSHLNST